MYICMYVCMYMYVYIYIHIYAYVCIYIHTYIHIYVCIYIHTYICICMYICVCICIYVYVYMTSEKCSGNEIPKAPHVYLIHTFSILLCLHISRQVLGPFQPAIQRVSEFPFSGLKQ